MAVALLSAACSASHSTAEHTRAGRRGAREMVRDKETDLERRVAELELRLLEKEAQAEELQSRLDDTRNEVVRTMAKLQTVASRAEAASGMAEAEIALQSLKANGGAHSPEVTQVTRLVRQSSAEFNKQNYGGALYLAGQAKALAGGSKGGPGGGSTGSSRAGETPFAVPIRLRSTGRGNVREGPGTNFDVAFSLDGGSPLTGYSYVDEWVRVSDEHGRSGWIFRALVTRR
ncbi:MAG: SH3 domain-containing protein [Gemmatimonadaceae bacterium]